MVKPWLLTPALLVVLNALAGIDGLWFAFPIADALLLVLTLTLVLRVRLIAPVSATPSAKGAE